MHKKKVIHIHTDYKFINNSNFFDGDLFDNRIIIIQNSEPYTGPFKDKSLLFSTTSEDLKRIINICKEADLVVLYDLNTIKCRITLALPSSIKIAWRFFGYELYGRQKDNFVSEKTLQFVFQEKQQILLDQILKPIKKLYAILKFGGTRDNLFYKAMNRINYMLVLCFEEYDFLSNFWSQLPEFVQLPFPYYLNDSRLPDFYEKTVIGKPMIVLGNNRSLYNNHLDLIELVDRKPNKNQYIFTLLFSYGPQNEYTMAVKEAVIGKKYYTLIEDFVSPEKFETFHHSITALVINSYRQMAGANVRMALRNGSKVYLNKKNIYFKWLRNEGFKVFTIEDFDSDLTNNNIKADKTLAEYNVNQLVNISKKYTKEDFQQKLYQKII